LTSQSGLTEGTTNNPNTGILVHCPTLSDLQTNGVAAYPVLFWVVAANGAIIADVG